MKQFSEEHRRKISEAMRRHWATVSPEEREKYRERGRVVGRMVAARMTAEDKAAFAALVRTPEARARNVDALAKRNARPGEIRRRPPPIQMRM